jgi:hypothetical protein
MSSTIRIAVASAIAAHEGLARVAEPIEDEWQYVTDLGTVWRARLAAVVSARGDEHVSDDVAQAVARVSAEAGLVADPHRAIDWLSTLPQVVLLALGEAT